jgi:arabinan endo-1,5-alpha-L-arabinosidase
LSLQDYSDCNCQKWLIASASAREDVSPPEPVPIDDRLRSIYPNPVIKGKLVNIVIGPPGKYITTNIYSNDGKLVYSGKQLSSGNTQVPAPKKAGVYLIKVIGDESIITQKLIVE